MVGIYKITSPSGKVYIGQSWQIEKRWYQYKYLVPYQRQFKLLNSFNKYGLDKHSFEVIHELPNDINQSVLDEYEILYINQYSNCGVELMNCTEGGKGGKLCDERKKQISKSLTGRKHSEQTKKKIGEANRLRVLSDETKNKISKANKGRKCTEETKQKLSIALNGRTISEHIKQLISDGLTGKQKTEQHKKNISLSALTRMGGEGNPNSKLTALDVIRIRKRYESGEYTMQQLADESGIKKSSVFSIIHRLTWSSS